MKTHIITCIALTVAVAGFAQTTDSTPTPPKQEWVVAVRDVPNCQTSLPSGWTLEIGEVFPLIFTDGTCAHLKMDKGEILAPANAIQYTKATTQVLAMYRAEVLEHHRVLAEKEAVPASTPEPAPPPGPRWVIAVKEVSNCRDSWSNNWTLEVGEVFPLVSIEGDWARLKMDDGEVIAPVDALQYTQATQQILAAYHAQVLQNRKGNEAADATTAVNDAAQADADYKRESLNIERQKLDELRRMRMLQGANTPGLIYQR